MLKHTKIFSGNSLAYSFLGLALCAVPSWAQQSVLYIGDSAGDYVQVTSAGATTYGGTCSAAACPGTAVASTASITWNGKIGTLFTVTGAEGQNLGTPDTDLGLTTASATASGTLIIKYSAYYTSGTGPFSIGGTASGAGTTPFSTYIGATAFATTTAVGPSYGAQSPTNEPASPVGAFWLTTVATVPMVSGSTPNFDMYAYGTASTSTGGSNPLTLSCGSAKGEIGVPYSSSLVASGGVPTYTFSITPANAISPLSLNTSSGLITGTPLVAGTLTFTAKVVDSSGIAASNSATASCKIVVAPKITVQCPTSTATVNVYYSSSIPVTGGQPPYTYAVVFGSLPTGLSLSNVGGVEYITGTPTKASQTGAFKIEVTDSNGVIAYTSCSGSCSNGLTVTYGGGQSTSGYGQKGTSGSYNSNGLPLNCYGFSTTGSPTNLYSNNVQGNTELGLSNWNNNNQIDSGHFVQFDISSHTSSGANGVSISADTFDWNASFDVYGSNTQGSLGTLLASNVPADSNTHSVPNCSSYKYVCVKAHSGNCLIQSVQFSYQCACAIDVSLGQSGGQGGWGGNGGGGYGGGSCGGFNGYGGGSGGNNGYSGGQNPGQCGW